MLEVHDHTKEIWISAGGWPEPVPGHFKMNRTLWPDYPEYDADEPKFWWSTGALGWWFSNSMLRLYADNLDKFVKTSTLDLNCNCGSRWIGLFLTMMGKKVRGRKTFWGKK